MKEAEAAGRARESAVMVEVPSGRHHDVSAGVVPG